jgi:hypothetical protein
MGRGSTEPVLWWNLCRYCGGEMTVYSANAVKTGVVGVPALPAFGGFD